MNSKKFWWDDSTANNTVDYLEKDWKIDEVRLRKLRQKCEKCKFRFKCFTSNTSERPEQLDGINFKVAECCIRCKHGNFRRTKDGYRRLGRCTKHDVAVHQYSYCSDYYFDPKVTDNLTYRVYKEMEEEMQQTIHNYGLPRYCIVDRKDISVSR